MNDVDPRLPAWAGQAKALLDASADAIDAGTASRLNRARQAALAQYRPRPRRWILPAGLATACTLLLALFTWQAQRVLPGAAPESPSTRSSADLDLVSSDDSLELYQDLEFYAWLEAQDQDLGS